MYIFYDGYLNVNILPIHAMHLICKVSPMLSMAGKKVKCSDLKPANQETWNQSESVQTQRFPILSCEKKLRILFLIFEINSHTRKECLESMTPKILWVCAVDLESCVPQNVFFKDGDQVCNPSCCLQFAVSLWQKGHQLANCESVAVCCKSVAIYIHRNLQPTEI